MNKLKKLEIKKLIQEYNYVLTDLEYKNELIGENKPLFLKLISDRKVELGIEDFEDKEERGINNEDEISSEIDKFSEPDGLNDFSDNNIDNLESDDLNGVSEDKEEDLKIKKLFRDIVKKTHPDRIGNDSKIDLYIKSKELYENRNFIELYFIAINLEIDIELEESDISNLKNSLINKKKESKSLENSYLWLWIVCEDDNNKKFIVDKFIKDTVIQFGNPKKRTNKKSEKNIVIEDVLKEVYSISPYLKYRNNTEFKNKIDSTYIETPFEIVDNIVSYFNKYFNKDTIFYDLGSGIGKMVCHIGLKYNIKKSIGIEYSKERISASNFILDNYLKNANNIKFINNSFLNINFNDANVIYFNNICIDNVIVDKVLGKVPKNCLVIFRKNILNKHKININKISFLSDDKKYDFLFFIKN
jgi:hypothetical protein